MRCRFCPCRRKADDEGDEEFIKSPPRSPQRKVIFEDDLKVVDADESLRTAATSPSRSRAELSEIVIDSPPAPREGYENGIEPPTDEPPTSEIEETLLSPLPTSELTGDLNAPLSRLLFDDQEGTARSALSSLSLTLSASSTKTLVDWHRATDRNLCHVYRLCEEFLQRGHGQHRPDVRSVRAIDFTMQRKQICPDVMEDVMEKADLMKENYETALKVKRATGVLKGCKYFAELDSSMPGFISKLAHLADFVWEVPGQIIVRQGDPSGSVYILVTGEVGIHILAKKLLAEVWSPRPAEFESIMTMSEWQRQENAPPDSPLSPDSPTPGRRGSNCKGPARRKSNDEGKGRRNSGVRRNSNSGDKGDGARYLTCEGFSTFTTDSNIGKEVAKMGPGAAFGERGAKGDNIKRSATVKCTAYCELLLIQANNFRNVMRDVYAKTQFFDNYLPGCKAEAASAMHPSTAFLENTYADGHAFLTEGISSGPVVYLIHSGKILLKRCEDHSDDPVRELGSRPLPRSKEYMAREHAALTYDVLTAGDSFCSLSAFPICASEPFSAIAEGECKIYHSDGHRFDKIPPNMLESVRVFHMQGLVARLLRVREKVPEAFAPPLKMTPALHLLREKHQRKQQEAASRNRAWSAPTESNLKRGTRDRRIKDSDRMSPKRQRRQKPLY